MPWILLGAAVIAILAFAANRGNASTIVQQLPGKDASSAELLDAADKMEAKGLTETAQALRDKADIVQEAERREAPLPKIDTGEIPIPGVSLSAWTEFVKRSIRQKLGEKSPSGAMGMFALSKAALAKVKLDGVPEANYLSNPQLQYTSFYKYIDLINQEISGSEWIQKMQHGLQLIPPASMKALTGVEGVPVTLSGLLGLWFYTGPQGSDAWLRDGMQRRKLGKVTANFKRFNGLF